MRRRRVLQSSAAAVLATVAGCVTDSSGDGSDPDSDSEDTSSPWRLSDAVYHPAHSSGMKMIGTQQVGNRTVGLSYTYAERFWTVAGTRTKRVAVESEYNAVHLMAAVWHTETGTVLPIDTGFRVRVEHRDEGDVVTERDLWPMLSQQMGAHFGDNIQFPAQGEYTIVVETGDTTVERLGALKTLSEENNTAEFDFKFQRNVRNEIEVEPTGAQPFDSAGDRDALQPMEMSMQPHAIAPAEGDLPGRTFGEETSGDAVFVVVATDSTDGTYLAVSPRTPYNQYILPLMSLSATVERGETTVFDGPLSTAVGPEREYHYGTVVKSIEPRDKLTITVDTPPQAARHVGYETAFIDMPDVRMTL